MAGVLQHLRSSTLNKRPNPASMVDGQLAINYASGSPGAFFKDTNGNLVKVGPVHVGATAPNVSPASGGTAGNSLGEQWLDTSGGTYVFKIWDGAAWRSEAGEFVNSTGDTMTGSLTMGPSANLIFEGSTDDGFETTLTVVDPTADRTITLPNVSGTVVTTGDTGTITSTMIADGTIVDGDINASAAIAGTKISPAFGSQNVTTTGTSTAASFIPTSSTVPTNGVYLPAANSVAISTNSTQRLLIDASGNVNIDSNTLYVDATNNRVGIGATPLAKFHVNLGTNENIHFATGGSGDQRIQALNDAGGTSVQLSIQASPLLFRGAGGSEVGRWDTSGRLLVGTSSALDTSLIGAAAFQVAGGTNATSQLSVSRFSGNSDLPRIALIKSRSGTVGSNAIVQSGDGLGEVAFIGADGSGATGYPFAASIGAYVDGTPGTNDMPGRLVFSTTADGASSPTERMRISQDGGTLWRSNGATSTHDLGNSNTSITGEVVTVSAYRNTVNDTFKFVTCVRQGFAVALEIRDDGDVYNVNGTYGSLSDAKLKENIVDANSQWDDIKQLRVRNYNFKPETNNSTHKQIGVIAQEIENVSPGLVNTVADRDAEGNDLGTVTKSVNYSVLYMKAVKALQEAMERIETLEAKVAALESA